MNTNCNIYNGSRARLNNIQHLKALAAKLENGEHLLAVFDNGCASSKRESLVEIPSSFFRHEEFCDKVGSRKANNQMIVFVKVDNKKYTWTLLHIRNGKAITDDNVDNLIIW